MEAHAEILSSSVFMYDFVALDMFLWILGVIAESEQVARGLGSSSEYDIENLGRPSANALSRADIADEVIFWVGERKAPGVERACEGESKVGNGRREENPGSRRKYSRCSGAVYNGGGVVLFVRGCGCG